MERPTNMHFENSNGNVFLNPQYKYVLMEINQEVSLMKY